MRKVKGILVVIALLAGVFVAETSAADKTTIQQLEERLDAQARRIKTLEAHVAILRKTVKRLKKSKSESKDENNDKAKKDESEGDTASNDDSKAPSQLQKINSALHQWDDYHYIKYQWRERKGWDVVQGQDQRAYKLVGSKKARWSRIMHKHEFPGDFAVSATVLARGSARLEIVHAGEDKPYKQGFRVDFPDGKPARVMVRRQGETMTATINGQKVEVQEKHYGGDVSKPCYVALTVDKGDTLLLRNVQLYGAE